MIVSQIEPSRTRFLLGRSWRRSQRVPKKCRFRLQINHGRQHPGSLWDNSTEAHAGPESAYFACQQAPTRVLEREDPKSVIRAHDKLVIERGEQPRYLKGKLRIVSAPRSSLNRNSRLRLPVAKPRLCLFTFGSKHHSQCEATRWQRFMRPRTPKSGFDYTRWGWETGEKRHVTDHSSASLSGTLVGTGARDHGAEHEHDGDDSHSVTFSMIFGREGSPLTELPEELDR